MCRGRGFLAAGLSVEAGGEGTAAGRGDALHTRARPCARRFPFCPRRTCPARRSWKSSASGRARGQPGAGRQPAAARLPRTRRARGGGCCRRAPREKSRLPQRLRAAAGFAETGSCCRRPRSFPWLSRPGGSWPEGRAAGVPLRCAQSVFFGRHLTSGAVPSSAGGDGENSHPEQSLRRFVSGSLARLLRNRACCLVTLYCNAAAGKLKKCQPVTQNPVIAVLFLDVYLAVVCLKIVLKSCFLPRTTENFPLGVYKYFYLGLYSCISIQVLQPNYSLVVAEPRFLSPAELAASSG